MFQGVLKSFGPEISLNCGGMPKDNRLDEILRLLTSSSQQALVEQLQALIDGVSDLRVSFDHSMVLRIATSFDRLQTRANNGEGRTTRCNSCECEEL